MFKPLLSTHIDNDDPELFEQITSLWIKALRLPGGIDLLENFYGVYHNYENNSRNGYDLSISIKAQKNDPPINLISLGSKYREFTVGEILPENTYKTWCEIWELEKKGELNRQYYADYEEYRPDGTAAIFINIK